MPDVWDQFHDAKPVASADPWAQFPDAQKSDALRIPTPSTYDTTMEAVSQADPRVGQGEAALNFGTNMLATPLAGLAGIAGAVLPGPQNQALDWTEGVQRALTYQPRSTAGQDITSAAQTPFAALARGAD